MLRLELTRWLIPILALAFAPPGQAQRLRAELEAKLLASLAPPTVPAAVFGHSVAVSGNTLVVARLPGPTVKPGTFGAAYVYERAFAGAPWTLRAQLRAPDVRRFGRAVAIDGDTIVVLDSEGTPEAHVFVRPAGGWSGILTGDARLSRSDTASVDFLLGVDISGDTIAIGNPGQSAAGTLSGAAYVYVRPSSGWAGTLTEDATLIASDAVASLKLGDSISMLGDTIVVGAGGSSVSGPQGAAYVYDKPPAGWSGALTEDARLMASDGAETDRFGLSVAFASGTVAVGAFRADGAAPGSGGAYVFAEPAGGWSGARTEDAKLTASDGSTDDNFGLSVALLGDTVVVGARIVDPAGAVYVYEKPAAGWAGSLTEGARITASDLDPDDAASFGVDVALSGETLAIGALHDHYPGPGGTRAGSAYTLERPAGGWSLARHAHSKVLPGIPDFARFDGFGSAVVDGDVAVIGAPNATNGGFETGSAYIFLRAGVGWRPVAKLTPSDGGMDDFFGSDVAISGDTVVVSAHGHDPGGVSDAGAAYVFVRPLAGWFGALHEDAKLLPSDAAEDDSFGRRVAVSGSTVVVGAPDDDDGGGSSGSAYVFVEPVGGWSGTPSESAKLLASDAAVDDVLGSVGIAGDTIVVGAAGDDQPVVDAGSAYVFREPTAGWAGTLFEDAKLVASDAAPGDAFGFNVAIAPGTIAVGAALGDGAVADSGSAYVFVEPVAGWSETLTEDAELIASSGTASDFFGFSIRVSGNRIATSAPFADTAYVFEAPVEGWSGTLVEALEIAAIDGMPGELFGTSLGLDADTLVAGAVGDDDGGSFSGSAYVYALPESDGLPALAASIAALALLRARRRGQQIAARRRPAKARAQRARGLSTPRIRDDRW